MKNFTRILCVIFATILIASCAIIGVGASSAYQTYTYSIDGYPLLSPDAYDVEDTIDSEKMKLEVPLNAPSDIITDKAGNVYIADTGNNRVVVLSRYYEFKFQISTFKNSVGNDDTLSGPRGVFVSDDTIWVCDTGKSRIVAFNLDGSFKKILEAPESHLFGEDAKYEPIALAVDDYNRLFVVSASTYQGIIILTDDGKFQKFIGAQATEITAWEKIWRKLRTEEQQSQQLENVSTEFNNIALSSEGFIYVTTSTIADATVQSQILGKATDGTYMPVKKLNTSGDEIMARNGFWPPVGEIDYNNKSKAPDADDNGVSKIVDVAEGEQQTWSIIDQKRSRIYTYDKNGNLLFAFGDRGDQLGNLEMITAICYQMANGMNNIIVLDAGDGGLSAPTINVYSRTEYGDLLIAALHNDNIRNYQSAVADYERILERNLNFDVAYIGKAKALYRAGDYNGAMEQYSYAYNTEGYSQAFKMFRKNWVSEWIWVIPIVAVAAFAAIYFFFKYAGKVNAKTAITSGKRTFGQELLFAFHLIFHPFDGFWDLKHEKRGSLRGAAFYISLTILVFTYQSVGRSYMYNPTGEYQSIWMQIAAVGIPVGLFAAANWCITTLFDGEGSFKDIIIAAGYSLVPLVLFTVPTTLMTHILSSAESGIITLFNALAFVWVGLLLFFGIMITQDYSLFKNLLTIVVTILGMAFIMFIIILFITLVSDIFGLITNIATEISYRM